ncbi:MAG: hypothetical protein ACT4P5_07320, partial [Armatimonadota bacterium]
MSLKRSSVIGLLLAVWLASLAVVQAARVLPQIPNPKVAADAPEIGRYGRTLVDAQVSEPRTFNPVIVTDVSTGRVLGPLFDGLVEANYITGEIEPSLAESWTLSQDRRTWTFT